MYLGYQWADLHQVTLQYGGHSCSGVFTPQSVFCFFGLTTHTSLKLRGLLNGGQ